MTEAPPKRKTSRGLWILLGVIGGGFALVCLVIAVGAYKVMSTPEGRKVVGIMGDAVRITQKAQNAPGTKELRKAGCQQALVMDLDDFARLGGLDASVQDAAYRAMVVCTVAPWGKAPDCGDLAKRYVVAVSPKEPFALMTSKTGDSKPVCSGIYAANGERKSGLTNAKPPPGTVTVPASEPVDDEPAPSD